jgi:hypothetical protein
LTKIRIKIRTRTTAILAATIPTTLRMGVTTCARSR